MSGAVWSGIEAAVGGALGLRPASGLLKRVLSSSLAEGLLSGGKNIYDQLTGPRRKSKLDLTPLLKSTAGGLVMGSLSTLFSEEADQAGRRDETPVG